MRVLKKPLKSGLEYSLHAAYPRIKLVLKSAGDDGFEEVRCGSCKTLLYRMKGRLHKSQLTQVEVKCRKCGAVHLD
jgi:hypothetical protein